MPLRVHLRSLGCKVNLADARETLARLGERVRLEEEPEKADVVLLNTCTVTHKADRDSRKILGSLGKELPGLPVVVTGCATRTCRESLARYPNVRCVIDPGEPERVAQALLSAAGRDFEEIHGRSFAGCGMHVLERQRAFLKVQDGCNSRCSYCVIPSVRGPERSLEISEVERNFQALVSAGHLEIVLVGIHLGRYGVAEGRSLVWLLERLERLCERTDWPGRIRLTSIEPAEWTEELLQYLSQSKRVCPHFHIPVQSGSATVLARMGRRQDPDAIAHLLDRLARDFPDAALGTDIITGFPQESDAEAAETERWVEKMPFSYLHVFQYSKRPMTPAAQMEGQIHPLLIRQRSRHLLEIGRDKWLRFLRRGIGRHHDVIVERMTGDLHTGRSESYRKLRWKSPKSSACKGELARVLGKSVRDGWLVGEPVLEG